LDHLIYTLCEVAIPHFISRHHRQDLGFEGPDLALKHQMEVTKRAMLIPRSDLQLDPETRKYIVRSQSDPTNIFYEVDLDAYDCTCLSFPLIRFCKHIGAIQHHFPEAVIKIPVNTLAVPLGNDEDSLDTDPESDSPVAIDNLAHRLESLMFSCLNPPSVMTDKLRLAIISATRTLDVLHSDLALPPTILPPQKVKVAPNKHSDWEETKVAMHIGPVKSKKRKEEYDPYGGKERSGKKAKSDARDPPPLNVHSSSPPDDTLSNAAHSHY
ncbi:hypothetical protein DFH07DRAFT_720669, partial [Mycena maculata]